MFSALLSYLTARPIRPDVAMTGEITLRGSVLPVGGIKEKVLAAARASVRTIILPADNENDLVDVPENVRDNLKFHFIKRMDELVPLVLKAESHKRKADPTLNGKASRNSNASKTGKGKKPSVKSKRRGAKAKT